MKKSWFILLLLTILFVSCIQEITIAPKQFEPFKMHLKIDSVHCVDTISAYSSDDVMVFFHLPQWRKYGIGVETIIDTTGDTSFLHLVVSVFRDTSVFTEHYAIADSMKLSILYESTLRKRFEKYLSIGDSVHKIMKTIFLTDLLEDSLPVLTDQEIPAILTQSNGISVYCVESRYCRPCVLFRPIYLDVARTYCDSGVTFYVVPCEKSMQFVKQFDVMATPTCIIIDSFKCAARIVGQTDGSSLRLRLSELLHD